MNLVALTPLGGEATSVRFFEPNQRFFDALKPFKDETLIDVGAGRGHVTVALRDKGYRIVGIDVRTEGADTWILEANAATFNYPKDSVGLLLRPCHGLFVTGAIEQMVNHVNAIVYVSKPKNAYDDLGRYRKYFKRIITNVGAERESLYIWIIK